MLLHGSIDSIKENIEKRCHHIEIAEKLKKMNIGVIGKPSDWLISSDVNYDNVHRKWGITFNASHNFCRTQVKIKILQGYDYFLKFPLGNHHIISNGNHVTMFHELMDFFSVRAESAR